MKPKSSIKRAYPTPALDRGLDILELFASVPDALSVSEVARRLNRTVSEIFRMLLCLERRGYLAQSPKDDRYRLTLQVFKLGQEYPPTKRLISEALPIMHGVAHELRQSCHLGVLEGGSVMIVAQVDSPEPAGFYVKAGSRVDLMHASTGHVILAHQPPGIATRAILEWQRLTAHEIPSDLEKHLTRIRRQGYERRASYEITGVTNISVPVLNKQGYAIAALTVPYLHRIEDLVGKDEVLNTLREAASEMALAIGGFDPT